MRTEEEKGNIRERLGVKQSNKQVRSTDVWVEIKEKGLKQE